MNALKEGFITGEGMEELRLKHKKGHDIWFEVKGKTFLDKNRNKKVLLFLRDMSERMEADKILIDSEKKYRQLHEKSPNSRVIANSEGIVLDCNSATVKLFGFKKNELIGRNYKNLGIFSSEEIPIFGKIYNDLIQDKNPGQEQLQIIKKDGSIGWTLIQSSLIKLGNEILIESIFQDITERKKVQDELSQIGKAVESTSDAIGMSDPQGHHFFQNQAFTDLFEHSIEEIGILGGGSALYVDQEIGKEVFETIMNGDSWVGEVEMKSKNERIFPVFLRADAIKDKEGNLVGLIGVHTDITERKQVERELKKSEEKFRQAFNQAEFYKDIFSYDINNILNAIQLSSELSGMYLNNPEKVKDMLTIIGRHVDRGAKLVLDIQKLSRLDEIKIIFEPIDVNNTLRDSITFIKNTYPNKKIDIKIPNQNHQVLANEFLLDVFENIISNAVKYNLNPMAEINVKSCIIKDNGTEYLKLEFIDNGMGVPDIKKKAILEKGFEKDRRFHGLGIGLSLVKKTIESYNGRIWVENRVPEDYSKGSIFLVLIPLASNTY